GLDDPVDVGARQRLARVRRAVESDTGGAHRRRLRIWRVAGHPLDTDVPQLRHDRATLGVHGVHDAFPPGQRGLTVEPRGAVHVPCRRVVDVGALGDDQAGARGRATAVVRRDVLTGNAIR